MAKVAGQVNGRAYVLVSGERVWADVAARNGLQRFDETGELPPAWEDDAEFDRRLDEMNRELDALETGCLDTDDPRHPGHPVTCQRSCCRPVEWEP